MATQTNSRAHEQVLDYLYRPDIRPHVRQLVEGWNQYQLLGIDLSDLLRELVASTGVPLDYDAVCWDEIAENLALEICGVDEEELTRRRTSAGGTK